MKKAIWIFLSAVILFSCEKETTEIPDYKPGKLTKISNETSAQGSVFHQYEYSDNSVIEKFYYSSPEVFISKYHFKNNRLENVIYSFGNTEKKNQTDSLKFTHEGTIITHLVHSSSYLKDTILHFYKNGKISSSARKISSGSNSGRQEYFHEWNGDNLTKYESQIWFMGENPFTTSYNFKYSEIENPLYIPDFPIFIVSQQNLSVGTDINLAGLIPKCSKNLPSEIMIKNNVFPEQVTLYSLECELFSTANKPKMIRVNQTKPYTRIIKYSLEYEKQ
jgi:hypothetical protein